MGKFRGPSGSRGCVQGSGDTISRMRRPQIVEVKRRLDGTEARFPCDAALVEAGRRAVLIYLLDRPWDVPGVVLRAGMRTFGHFWMERPYNVYHWLDGERTVGLYFNIGECVEISIQRVVWNDYAVDVLITPDGLTRVLDEEELTPDVNLATRELVEATRDRVLAHASQLMAEVDAETRRLL